MAYVEVEAGGEKRRVWVDQLRSEAPSTSHTDGPENPAAPHQAVAANNLGNQASSAIPERGQQHPFDAVVTSGNGNGRQGAPHGASGDQQDSLREYGESYVKLLISTKYLAKEKREKIEEILTKEVQDYLKFHDHSGDSHGRAMKSFTKHLIEVYRVHLVTVGANSVIIILDCPTLDSLEHLWSDYLAGDLDKVADRYLVPGQMKEKLKLEANILKTTIEEQNYLNCKRALVELRSTYSGVDQVAPVLTINPLSPATPSPVQDNKPPQLSVKLTQARDVVASTTEWKDVHLPIDVLLLTVESCDFLSCYSLLGQPFRSYNEELGYVYFGRMGEASDEGKLWVALMTSPEGADTPGRPLTVGQIAFKVLQPKAVFSVGTCISLDPEEVRMGDVVISSKLTTADGFSAPVSTRLGRLAKDVPYGWAPPLENPGELEVNVHPNGDIMSLSLTEKRQYDDICKEYPGAVAIETEDKGVYAAAHTTNIEWAIVKGVASYFHQNHSATSDWNSFASTMAASVVAKLLMDPTVFREWRHYNQESFVKLFIWGKSLEKKKKEAIEEILTQVVEKYVKCNKFSKDNIEEDLKSFTDHLVDVYGVLLVTIGKGPVIIILDCHRVKWKL